MIFQDKLMNHMFITVVIYEALSIIVFVETLSFLNLMLGWNIALAFVPVFLAYLIKNKLLNTTNEKINKLIFFSLLIAWLFFFPNAFYVITDFIHLGSIDYYYFDNPYSPTIYIRTYEGYLMIGHIFIGAFISVFMAVYSLKMIETALKDRLKPFMITLLVTLLMVLSSVGIYIGRFLRFNSWDIFSPFKLLSEVFDSIDLFTFKFVLIFVVIHLFLYYFLKPFIKIEN